jgi:hypothetical protein
MPLEKLDPPFMLFGRGSGFERAQVATPPSFGISLPGIQTVFARRQLADHFSTSL